MVCFWDFRKDGKREDFVKDWPETRIAGVGWVCLVCELDEAEAEIDLSDEEQH